MSDCRLRMITKDGIDCIYNYKTDTLETYCAVDNFSETKNYNHIYLDQEKVDFMDVTKRLV